MLLNIILFNFIDPSAKRNDQRIISIKYLWLKHLQKFGDSDLQQSREAIKGKWKSTDQFSIGNLLAQGSII